MLTSKTTTSSETKKQNLQLPILVISEGGGIFYIAKYTNGNYSPCINFSEIGELPSLYTSQAFDLSKPFPQDGYDLFSGTVTLTQEVEV